MNKTENYLSLFIKNKLKAKTFYSYYNSVDITIYTYGGFKAEDIIKENPIYKSCHCLLKDFT